MSQKPTLSLTSKSSFSRSGLLGAFYWASLGLGAACGAIAYTMSALSGNDHASIVAVTTKAATVASAFTMLGTMGLFTVIAPFKVTSEYKKRAACAILGASLGLGECAAVDYFSQFERPEFIQKLLEEKFEPIAAPPVRADIPAPNNLG